MDYSMKYQYRFKTYYCIQSLVYLTGMSRRPYASWLRAVNPRSFATCLPLSFLPLSCQSSLSLSKVKKKKKDIKRPHKKDLLVFVLHMLLCEFPHIFQWWS